MRSSFSRVSSRGSSRPLSYFESWLLPTPASRATWACCLPRSSRRSASVCPRNRNISVSPASATSTLDVRARGRAVGMASGPGRQPGDGRAPRLGVPQPHGLVHSHVLEQHGEENPTLLLAPEEPALAHFEVLRQ